MNDCFKYIKMSHHLIKSIYVDHDVSTCMNFFHKECSWIGPRETDFFTQKDTITAYLDDIRTTLSDCELTDEEYDVVFQNANSATVMGMYTIKIKNPGYEEDEFRHRCSMMYVLEDGKWLVSHLHTSGVVDSMEKNDSDILMDIRNQNYISLTRLIKEKTEIIEMIDSNVRCGLKGSNDDDTFSFYYVNEGLYRMLGYTYDEFMEMSGGSAVGMVYPPDLDQALDDVAKCFAVGPDYSTEYRIRKKDGSFMWVIDSGRKHQSKSGQVQINSILMDITDLKQYQINLQLEQERYRIALENITDVMFEYDIKKDHMIKYEHSDNKKNGAVEKVFVSNYFNMLEHGNRIHLDDIGLFKEFLLETIDEKVISIRLYLDEGNWKWIEVRGTRIYEDNKPIKFIGIWKDITSEKIERERLIDLANRDALTGLYHQKSIEGPIKNILENNETCAMMIMDIDDFKGVNDTYGHLKGNEVLVAVKNILLEYKKDGVLISRIGGDEFMIFLSPTVTKNAVICANAILNDVRKVSVKGIKVTVSIGVAYSQPNEQFKKLFKKADTAMYHAKNNGRNQIAIFDEIKQ